MGRAAQIDLLPRVHDALGVGVEVDVGADGVGGDEALQVEVDARHQVLEATARGVVGHGSAAVTALIWGCNTINKKL